MATAASITQDVRNLYGDPDGEFITATLGIDWLNAAQDRFCHKVMPIDEVKDYTLNARQQEFDLPGNYLQAVKAVYLKDMAYVLQAEAPAEFERIQAGFQTSVGRPVYYTIFRRQVVVGPQSPVASSATALASGAQSSTAAVLNLTAASGTFRSVGYLYNASTGEVMKYASVSTSQVGYVQRGVHGTPAASISSNDLIIQVDLQFFYRALATAISTTTQTPDIPTPFQRYLTLYMLYRAWLARGDATKAQVAYNEFELLEKDTIETVGQRMLEPMAIKDRRGRTYGGGIYW